jgi:hypothetical protein
MSTPPSFLPYYASLRAGIRLPVGYFSECQRPDARHFKKTINVLQSIAFNFLEYTFAPASGF